MEGKHTLSKLMSGEHMVMSALTRTDDRWPLPCGEEMNQVVASVSLAKPDTKLA